MKSVLSVDVAKGKSMVMLSTEYGEVLIEPKEVKHNLKDFDNNDIYDIGVGTTKEDELFDYADVLSYLKTNKKHNDREKKMTLK